MIVIDTSAVMAILLEDKGSEALTEAVVSEDMCMSAGTYTELLVVALNRGLADVAAKFVSDLGVKILPVDADTAQQVCVAFRNGAGGGMRPGLISRTASPMHLRWTWTRLYCAPARISGKRTYRCILPRFRVLAATARHTPLISRCSGRQLR